MKIGITCYPTVGGSGILATRLGVEFAKKGNDIHFITYERPVAIQGIDYENVYVDLVGVVEYPLFKYPPYTIALGSQMARITRQNSLDFLHVHYSIPHSSAAFLARELTGKPYVVTLHGSDVTLLGSDPAYEPVNTMSVERADAITAVSKFMADEAHKSLGIEQDIKVIPNFVDPDEFHPAPCQVLEERSERDIVVIHVSNFRKVKRIQDLIYAMRIVTKEAPDSKLLLVGDGPERYNVESLVRELDLKENVLLTGYRSDVPDMLRCADVLVLCSQTESAPLTILEAMSSGVPVVATRVGGIPEIIKDGQNGYLVPVKSPEEIAEKLVLLNNSPDNIRNLAESARETIIEKYSISKILDQYKQVYESIIS